MSEEVFVITPEITPGAGGVADYTLRLMEELGDRITPRFILPNETKLPGGGKILLQYSAYGFDRVGYPKKLLRALIDWKKTTPGLLVIMFHEIWAFWPLLNKNRFVQRLHRAEIGKLVALADSIFTSTASQADHLRKLVPRCNVQVLPVGSNIRPVTECEARDAGCAIVFGLQNSRIRTLEQFNRLPKNITKVVTVGTQNSPAGDAAEKERLERFCLTNGYEMRGALPEGKISQLFGSASFALSVQDELSLTKSGTFMAYAAHGLNIISSAADSLGAEPLCWLIAPDEMPDDLKVRAEKLRAWQERTAAWPMIAVRVAETLRLTT